MNNNGFIVDEELLYAIAATIMDTVVEKKRLEDENQKLKERLEKHERIIDKQIAEHHELMGGILSGMINQVKS